MSVPTQPWFQHYIDNGWRPCDTREIIGHESNYDFVLLHNSAKTKDVNIHVQEGSMYWGRCIASMSWMAKPHPDFKWIFAANGVAPKYQAGYTINAEPLPLP